MKRSVTEIGSTGHLRGVISALSKPPPDAEAGEEPSKAGQSGKRLDFAEVYRNEFDFVWRSLRRLGVDDREVDDAAQEVFVVVHRRLADFEQRSSLRSWLFSIVLRVASQHRRTARRRPETALEEEPEAPEGTDQEQALVHARAMRLVYAALDALDEDKRAVFMLAELEQMTAPEIAELLGLKLNTVYSRLRAARRDFDVALKSRLSDGEP